MNFNGPNMQICVMKSPLLLLHSLGFSYSAFENKANHFSHSRHNVCCPVRVMNQKPRVTRKTRKATHVLGLYLRSSSRYQRSLSRNEHNAAEEEKCKSKKPAQTHCVSCSVKLTIDSGFKGRQ